MSSLTEAEWGRLNELMQPCLTASNRLAHISGKHMELLRQTSDALQAVASDVGDKRAQLIAAAAGFMDLARVCEEYGEVGIAHGESTVALMEGMLALLDEP